MGQTNVVNQTVYDSARIGMTAQRSERAINLFGEHDTRKFVGESHRRKREQQIRSRFPFGRQTVVTAYQENQVLAGDLGLLDELDEPDRIESAARWVEENLPACSVAGEQVEAARVYFPHFVLGIAAGAFHELLRHRIGIGITWFADKVKVRLHGAKYPVANDILTGYCLDAGTLNGGNRLEGLYQL